MERDDRPLPAPVRPWLESLQAVVFLVFFVGLIIAAR